MNNMDEKDLQTCQDQACEGIESCDCQGICTCGQEINFEEESDDCDDCCCDGDDDDEEEDCDDEDMDCKA